MNRIARVFDDINRHTIQEDNPDLRKYGMRFTHEPFAKFGGTDGPKEDRLVKRLSRHMAIRTNRRRETRIKAFKETIYRGHELHYDFSPCHSINCTESKPP
jgi:hypothetical protein